MTFPVTIRHRDSKVKIYAPAKGFGYYRVSYRIAGKRRMETFETYSEAKSRAKKKVKEIANGSHAVILTARQSLDALAAIECLNKLYADTGRRFTLLGAASHCVEVEKSLPAGCTAKEAITGFKGTVANVTRKPLAEAVADFILTKEPRTRANDGERAQLSSKYAYNLKIQLEKLAGMHRGMAVCDLGKDHVDKFIESLKDFSAKSRNHYRTAIRQFLDWCVRKDYLTRSHRLFEADSMRPEHANTAEIHFYTPLEFAALLKAADEALRPMVAIGGFAGLRTAELFRLDWKDVWRIPGHIEVTAGKAKTRQRRLVEICPALATWLESFRKNATGAVWTGAETTFQDSFNELCGRSNVENKGKRATVTRKTNGLRHAFCTYHFALRANENLTAQQAGNSPTMIHAHYKGLATKAEAQTWFNVLPANK